MNITNKTNMKQTAVGLLIQNIVEDQTIKAKSMSEWVMVFEKVKTMEKKQIMKSNRDGVDMVIEEKQFLTAEQYYNKTYKSE